MIVICTNRPFGIIAYLLAALESANKLSGAVARDINLVVMLVSINSCRVKTPTPTATLAEWLALAVRRLGRGIWPWPALWYTR
jgi:hypothetical protein